MGRLSKKEGLLRQAKNRSRINLSNLGNLPARFSDKDMSRNVQEKMKPQEKYLRESYYHLIKCITTTFLAVFMWRRLLNNVALTITTHKRSKGVFNGTST